MADSARMNFQIVSIWSHDLFENLLDTVAREYDGHRPFVLPTI